MGKRERKLKVLQLGKQYFPHIGGIEKTMQQFAEGIHGEMESFVLTSQGRAPAHSEMIGGVPVYYAKSYGIAASMPVSPDLVFYLRRHAREYDIIQLHMPFPLGDLACLLSGFKGKLVLYWHSDIVRQKKALLFYKPLMEWTLKRADAIAIATQGNIDGSPYVKPYEKKCVLIPFGLRRECEEASDRYWEARTAKGASEQKEDPAIALSRHPCGSSAELPLGDIDDGRGRPSGSFRLLFVGRLVYYKGCEVLAEAMELLKKTHPGEADGILLRVAGDGILKDSWQTRTEAAGLSNQVSFLGVLSDADLEKEYAACDVLVFPSVANSEAFGLVQLEAMAFGKPIINTNLRTGVPCVSLDGQTGLTVRPGDAKALADAIWWMKEHREERMEMGACARERVKAEFTQEKMLKRLMALYHKLYDQKI